MATTSKRLFICLRSSGYEVALEQRKIYVALPDAKAEALGQLRIVGERRLATCGQGRSRAAGATSLIASVGHHCD